MLDFINFYEMFECINPEMSVEEIQYELTRHKRILKMRAGGDSKEAIEMLPYIDKAQKAFENKDSKAQYDAQLEESKKPPKPDDPDEERRQAVQKWKDQADQHYQQKEYDLAKTAINNALARDAEGTDVDLRYRAAKICMSLCEFTGALEYINQAIVADQENPQYRDFKAQIEKAKADYDAWLEESKKPPETDDPDEERRQAVQKWKDQADQHYQQKEYDLAKIAINKALSKDIDGTDAGLRYRAAMIYMNLSEFTGALEYINLAIVAEPDNPRYYVAKALIFENEANTLWERERGKAQELLQSERNLCRQATDLADKLENAEEKGRALGILAGSLYWFEPWDEEQAERYAQEAVALGDPWGNGQNVLDDIWRRRDDVYNRAEHLSASSDTSRLDEAEHLFGSILGHRDARERLDFVREKKAQILRERELARLDGIYNQAVALYMSDDPMKLGEAARLFESILDHRDSRKLRNDALEKKQRIEREREIRYLDGIYNQAVALLAGNRSGQLDEAIRLFGSILDYRDSRQLRDEAIAKKQRIFNEWMKGRKRKKRRKLIVTLAVIAAIIFLLFHCLWKMPGAYSRADMADFYRKGCAFMKKGVYYDALDSFAKVDSHSLYYRRSVDAIYKVSEDMTESLLLYLDEQSPTDLEAVILLQDVMSRIPSDAPEMAVLDSHYQEYAARYREEHLNRIISLVNAGNYDEALTQLEKIISEIQNASGSITLGYLPGSLQDEIYDLYYTYSDGVENNFEDDIFWPEGGRLDIVENITDNQGNVHAEALVQFPSDSGKTDVRRATYSESRFVKITGTLFRTEEDPSGDAYLKFLSGDQELYSVTISPGDAPVEFEFDLQSVNNFTVIFHGLGQNGDTLAGISDLRLYKKIPQETE